jgi:hypothetical protein
MIRHQLSVILFALVASACQAAEPNLAVDDAALIAHIKNTDYIFTTALGHCGNEKVTRGGPSDPKRFEYVAFCSARAAQESDCSGYIVKATGTVDSPTWATVRDFRLELQCSG